ncbi:MAG: hypothetical protein GY839_14620 [candidate division Zixibacteria bacterium]|nr:hypothetical protein [candidate division Zixibacteria bacterium]
MKQPLVDNNISSIIGNQPLASAIHSSVTSALRCPFVHLVSGKTVRDIFKHSLDAAIRDIEKHPRGKLFRRLIEYGPRNPDDPETLDGDNETTLSDPECGSCVEFIFSHMINRFKGELSELLALDSCIKLFQQLRRNGRLPSDVQLYWGETIQERRKLRVSTKEGGMRWGGFTKGADGLLVDQVSSPKNDSHDFLNVLGVIEVKSMNRSKREVLNQINKHITRLKGGVKLGEKEWASGNLLLAPFRTIKKAESGLLRVMILPSTWKLSRKWSSEKTDRGRIMIFPKPSEPSMQTEFTELDPNVWKITLAWSQESLNQAAYEMTFWYMSQVGKHVYANSKLPKSWEYMTPAQAGYNAIKMMLYYIPLRYISKRQERLATRLYNVYCFGYPLGVDSNEVLWPEDFPEEDE